MHKNQWAVCFVYIATVIGAGFATGQEVYTYFVSCGVFGLLGIGLASLLLGVSCFRVLWRVHRDRISSFDAYLKAIMPCGMAKIVDVVVSLFLLCGFCVMAAAFGTTLQEHYGWIKWLCCLGLCAVCFLIFLRPVDLLVKVNALLAPIMIVGILLASICVIFLRDTAPVFSFLSHGKLAKNAFGFWWPALLYVSYNSLLACVILVTMRPYIFSKQDAVRIGVMGGGILGVLLAVIYAIIYLYAGKIWLGQIPMLTIVARLGSGFKHGYAFILLCAIFTTALGNGYGFIDRYGGTLPKERCNMAFLTCLLGFLLSFVPFDCLVKYLYGAFGVCGLWLLLCVIMDGKWGKNLKISKSSKKGNKSKNN